MDLTPIPVLVTFSVVAVVGYIVSTVRAMHRENLERKDRP